MVEPRRTFAPVVLTGLCAAGIAAVAGHRTWATADAFMAPGLVTGGRSTAGDVPVAGALALVALAAWGVLLVTRGNWRRVVAALALVVAAAMMVTGVLGWSSAVDAMNAELDHMQAQGASAHRTPWAATYLAVSALAAVAAALAVRFAPGWPEMGSRYDAPGSTPTPHEATGVDLWRALDEGRDPTLSDRRPTDP